MSKIKRHEIPGQGAIEKKGAWFIVYDTKGERVGAKMGPSAALALIGVPSSYLDRMPF